MSTYKERKAIKEKLKMVRKHSTPGIQVHKRRNRKKRKYVREELNQYRGSFRGFSNDCDE